MVNLHIKNQNGFENIRLVKGANIVIIIDNLFDVIDYAKLYTQV
jgi:hypothetical protein